MRFEGVIAPQEGPQTEAAMCSAGRDDLRRRGRVVEDVLPPARGCSRGAATGCSQACCCASTSRTSAVPGPMWEEAKALFEPCGARCLNSSPHQVLWPSGGHVEFNHLTHESSHLRYKSRSFTMIGIDECTEVPGYQFWYLLSRLRSLSKTASYLRGTCNPDPDSFVRGLIDWWVGEDGYIVDERSGVVRYMARRSRDVQVQDDSIVWADTRAELLDKYSDVSPWDIKSFTFIRGRLDDNKALTEKDPTYRTNIQFLDTVERERLGKGNWNITYRVGDFFNPRWFRVIQTDEGLGPELCRVRTWDFAATKPSESNKDPDWTRGILSTHHHENRACIRDMVSLRDGPGEVDQFVVETAKQDGRRTVIGIWQDPRRRGEECSFCTSAEAARGGVLRRHQTRVRQQQGWLRQAGCLRGPKRRSLHPGRCLPGRVPGGDAPLPGQGPRRHRRRDVLSLGDPG